MYEYNAKVTKIVDGDSVWLEVDAGFRMTYRYNFRLARINTPELRSSDPETKVKAYEAKDRLAELLPLGSTVKIATNKAGKYGRWIVEIWAYDGVTSRNVNDLMLEEGHAVNYGS
jgi:micrococcal nuclease